MNFRNSDCATVRVDYIKMSTVQCVANALFLTLKQFLVESRVLTVDLHLRMLTRKFLHEGFASPKEVVSLSQQERTAPVQRACEVFSIK